MSGASFNQIGLTSPAKSQSITVPGHERVFELVQGHVRELVACIPDISNCSHTTNTLKVVK